VESGDFIAIMGPSGCGKSTLLHTLGGLEPPDQGSVTIQGIDVYALEDEERSAFRRDHIGVVFQFFNLLPTLTAAEWPSPSASATRHPAGTARSSPGR
jgi:putative ABC transport system ATP-binding protein